MPRSRLNCSGVLLCPGIFMSAVAGRIVRSHCIQDYACICIDQDAECLQRGIKIVNEIDRVEGIVVSAFIVEVIAIYSRTVKRFRLKLCNSV